MTKKILLLVVGLVVGLLLASIPFGGHKLGSVVVHNVSESFDAGIDVNGTTVIDSSRILTVTGMTNSGNSTISGTLAVTATTTLAGAVSVGTTTAPTSGSALLVRQSASSTVYIGGASSAGCIALGDSANGANIVYITATGTTVTATTTKPAACR